MALVLPMTSVAPAKNPPDEGQGHERQAEAEIGLDIAEAGHAYPYLTDDKAQGSEKD